MLPCSAGSLGWSVHKPLYLSELSGNNKLQRIVIRV